MKWELDALKILARNETVPGVALRDAISEIERLKTQTDKNSFSELKLRAELSARIAELEEANRWIPVSERLPDYNGIFLVDTGEISICNFDPEEGAQFFYDPDVRSVSDDYILYPTHWRPLPQPPDDKADVC